MYMSFFERWHFPILIIILLSAFFLRTYDLADDPPGMYMDEVSSAYNAYSILQTGKDEHGNSFPLYFEAFGEYRHGLYIYSMIPSLFIFGLNDFGTRFTSVLFGMGCILVLYFITRRLFDKNIGLLAVAMLSIQPWHVHLSRVAFEGISFVFLLLLGLLLFLKGFEEKNWFFASAVIFGISMYSYGVAKLFVPLFLLGLILIYRNFFFASQGRILLLLCIFLFLSTAWPIYYFSFFGEGNARFQEGSVFILSEHPYFSLFLNYISHYTPSFLFFDGDAGFRHHLANWGVLYPIEMLFIIFGIGWCFCHLSNRQASDTQTDTRAQLLLLWLFLFALPASFMYGDTPHVLRTFIGAPLFALLTTIGIFSCWQFVQKKQKILSVFFGCIVFLLFGISAGIFFHEYFTDYKVYSYDYWMAYAEPMMEYTEEHHEEYDSISFSAAGFGRFAVYILYSIHADPQQYQEQGLESFGYRICNMQLNETCLNETHHDLYVFRGFELQTINGTYNIYYPDNETIAVKMFE